MGGGVGDGACRVRTPAEARPFGGRDGGEGARSGSGAERASARVAYVMGSWLRVRWRRRFGGGFPGGTGAAVGPGQPESLILAQNERWRHA